MAFPMLPEAAPRRGSRATRRCWQALLGLWGWEFEGALPNLPRFVLIGAPHTSNWDFVIAITAIGALGLRVTWLGKHTLFRWPFGPVLRRLGGVAVDRRASHGLVGFATEAFRHEEALVIGIAPEGTRRRTVRWKTGFYHIAAGAGVPIVPVYLDYRRRRMGTGVPIHPTGDAKADLKRVYDCYAPYARAGRWPALFSLGEDA